MIMKTPALLTNEVIKYKIQSGEFETKNPTKYYINYRNLIYLISLRKTTSKLKRELGLRDKDTASIHSKLSPIQLRKVAKADSIVSTHLLLWLNYTEIKTKFVSNH